MNLRTRLFALFAMAVLCASNAHAVDYNGTGVGAIPDNNATGLTISFNAASFGQQVGDVRVQLTLTHTFVRDLRATLTSPSGVSRLVLFGRPGLNPAGTTSTGAANLSGTYVFSDSGKDFWGTAVPLADGFVVPPGNYRTSTPATGVLVSNSTFYGGCFTSLTGAFLGLNATDASGTWTLTIADLATGDTGSVSAAVLSLSPLPDIVFRSGLEVAPTGSCRKSTLDYTGSGRSSYAVVRNTGGGANGATTWFIRDNDRAGIGTLSEFIHGIASDSFVTGDWDGDGIGDAAVWRAGTPGAYIIRLSSRPTRPLTVPFGLTGDDPSIVDDFNGDGLTDFAVYRAGATAGAPSQTVILYNNSQVLKTFTTGENGHFPISGDYNGDGAADIGTQRNAGGGTASFQLYSGLSGAPLGASFILGTPTDIIQDGNHTGSSADDITLVRAFGGVFEWTTRDGATGAVQPMVQFGTSATDRGLFGDYDGDGLDDYAVWRGSTTPGQSKFFIRQSSSASPTLEIAHGQNGDLPIGNTRRH